MKKIVGELIDGYKDKPIVLDVFFEETNKSKPIVIFSHGFKGFKDWGHFNKVAEEFASAGFVFVKFNYSHNGTTPENPNDFVDLEAFGNNNLLMELEELGLVLDHVLSPDYEFRNEIDKGNVSLIGHSRGGGIVTIKAFEDDRVSKLVCWASVSNFDQRIPKSSGEIWKKNGVMIVPNARTNVDMPIYYQMYESYYANHKRLSVPDAMKRLAKPVLLIQGSEDEAVLQKEAEQLKNWNNTAKLLIIKEAGHTFGIRHPFVPEDYTIYAENVVNESITFINSN
ncbi:MAG: dienelactone hydrolase family protein [Flavobacteriales bacterium]|nr:dienelactone hydrolase family protein [Flavobacteriales bacterium]